MTAEERTVITCFLLGKAHSGIGYILNMSDHMMRARLQQLFDELNDDVAKTFYSNHDLKKPE